MENYEEEIQPKHLLEVRSTFRISAEGFLMARILALVEHKSIGRVVDDLIRSEFARLPDDATLDKGQVRKFHQAANKLFQNIIGNRGQEIEISHVAIDDQAKRMGIDRQNYEWDEL